MKKFFLAAIAVGMLLSTASCGLSDDGSDVQVPAAYYQTVNGQNDCYYVTSPVEAQTLVQDGLCPANSVPYQMPVYWEEEYYPYYSSPAYYNTYVPASSRSIYVKYTIVSFKTKYSAGITKYSSKAVYKSSSSGTGSTYKSTTKSYGGGNRNSGSSGYGGGSRSYSGRNK